MSRKRSRKGRTPQVPKALDPDDFTIGEYREYVLGKFDVGPGDLAGCSPGEIDHLMRVQQVGRVPRIYREFLAAMGKNPRPLMPDIDWNYKDLLQIKGDMRAELEDLDDDVSWLDDALMIALGGGHFAFYIPNASTAPDDPPVWTCDQGENRRQSYATFRRFLLAVAADDY